MAPHGRSASRLRWSRLARGGRPVHVQPHGPRAVRRARRARLPALPDDRRLVAAARDRERDRGRHCESTARATRGTTCRCESACATGTPSSPTRSPSSVEQGCDRVDRGLALAVRVARSPRARTARRSPRRLRRIGGIEIVEAPLDLRAARVRRLLRRRRRAAALDDIEPNEAPSSSSRRTACPCPTWSRTTRTSRA